MKNLNYVDYSEKAFAIVGETKQIKSLLQQLGGRYNPKLKCGAGWIFSKKKTDVVKTALKLAMVFLIAVTSFAGQAQSVQRNGNVFSNVPRTEKVKEKKPDVPINAQWEDNDGVYQLYIGDGGGLYYYKVAKKGKHAGELTRRYLPKQKAQEIKTALGISK